MGEIILGVGDEFRRLDDSSGFYCRVFESSFSELDPINRHSWTICSTSCRKFDSVHQNGQKETHKAHVSAQEVWGRIPYVYWTLFGGIYLRV